MNVCLVQLQAGIRILWLLDQMIDNARLIVARQQFTVECDQFAELQTAFSIRESIRDLVLSFVQLDLHLSGGRIVGEVALQIERRPFVLLV